jgi:Flp pilus assembly pilin Flp
LVAVRLARLRDDEERDRGASAIEWAIITAILALLAITIGAIITKKVTDKANTINTG